MAEVGAEEERLILAQQQLTARIEDFRTHRQTLAARYSAAEAQVRVNEALGGVTKEFAELGMAVGRAEEKMDRMLAHASAIGALVDSGVLASPVSNGGRHRGTRAAVDCPTRNRAQGNGAAPG